VRSPRYQPTLHLTTSLRARDSLKTTATTLGRAHRRPRVSQASESRPPPLQLRRGAPEPARWGCRGSSTKISRSWRGRRTRPSALRCDIYIYVSARALPMLPPRRTPAREMRWAPSLRPVRLFRARIPRVPVPRGGRCGACVRGGARWQGYSVGRGRPPLRCVSPA